jgi:F-type H+-transporting ATPase subunit a
MIVAEGSITDELLDFHLFGKFLTAHQFLLILCGVLMVVMFTWAARKLPKAPKKTGFLALLEFGLVWVRDEVVYPWLGPEQGRRYLPFAWTLFFFVLISNLFGLFPFTVVPQHRTDVLSVATGNIAVTAALAVIVFVVVMFAGFKKHGLLGYWGTLVPAGVPAPLAPFILILEAIGQLTRHFALAIRLFANMLAGHALLGILFGFTLGIEHFAHPQQGILQTVGAAGFLLFIYLFEVLIALIQAYIFTILAIIFVSLSTAEAH